MTLDFHRWWYQRGTGRLVLDRCHIPAGIDREQDRPPASADSRRGLHERHLGYRGGANAVRASLSRVMKPIVPLWQPWSRGIYMHPRKFAADTKSRRHMLRLAFASLIALSGWQGLAHAAAGDTQRISAGGTPPTLSANGRYVGFRWDGLPDPDSYFYYWNIYVTDRSTLATKRISSDATNWEPHDDSYLGNNAALSAGGRYVAYMSQKHYDVPGNVPYYQVLVYDRQSRVTETIARFDGPGPSESFEASSDKVSISGDGRFVVFDAHRADLVPGDTNGTVDVFVYDRSSKALSRVSVGSDGHEGNGISDNATITPDGRYVAFWSSATNLVPGDTNGVSDVFLHDRQTGATERVSVDFNAVHIPAGYGNLPPALSSDARYVAFVAPTGELNGSPYFDVFVRDRVAHVTQRINTGPNGASVDIDEGGVSLSADGRYVAFASRSSNLVPGDTNTFSDGHTGAPDVFVHDRATGEVEIASVKSNGLQLQISGAPSLSADGRLVAFFSYKLDAGRRNESVYVHELGGTSIWGYRLVGGSAFGAQSIGTTSTARIYSVQNTGAVPLTIERVELRGTDAAQFVLDSRCGTTLAVGAKCNVKVSFAPKTVGAKTAKLAVVFGLREGKGAVTKNLTGIGVQ